MSGRTNAAGIEQNSVVVPRWVARFNRVVTNRIQGLWSPYLPPWAVVEHRGRKSGRAYRTPVLAFKTGDDLAIALPYGDRAQWVLNLQAAGGAVVRAGRTRSLVDTEVVDVDYPGLPLPVRALARLSRRVLLVRGVPVATAAATGPRPVAFAVGLLRMVTTVVLTLVRAFPSAQTARPVVGDRLTQYQLGKRRGPATITTGPDGNLWFAEMLGDRVGRITPDGRITEFSDGIRRFSGPDRIATGPDGNLWFTQPLGNSIGRITPDGAVTEYRGLCRAALPFGITAGPDGNLWFTESLRNRIGRITPDGQVTEFPAGPNPLAMPTDIVTGPDGNLWYTERFGGIGRITPTGEVTTFTGVTFGAGSVNITTGPDGALWFTETFGNRIGRITTDGEVTEYSSGLSRGAMPVSITTGPDGNLWFTEYLGSRVGRISPDGQIAEMLSLPSGQVPDGITVGPDNNLWFVEVLGSRINRLDITDVTDGGVR